MHGLPCVYKANTIRERVEYTLCLIFLFQEKIRRKIGHILLQKPNKYQK